MDIYYRAGVALARTCLTAFGDWTVYGKEYVPPKGPLIVVANHLSNADPPVVMASLNRQLYALGKQELFKNSINSFLLRKLGVFPVNRGETSLKTLNWSSSLLREGKAILVFPEGTRSTNAKLQQAKPGVGHIAIHSQAAILPVGITGTETIPGLWRVILPMSTVTANIGQPFTLPYIEGRITRSILQQATDIIMYRVANLLPSSYQGYYSMSTTPNHSKSNTFQ